MNSAEGNDSNDKGSERFCLRPWYPALLTVLLLVTGGIGSVFSEDIKSAPPFNWLFATPTIAAPLLFWGLGLLCGWAFFYRQKAVDTARQAAENKMIERAEELAKLIRTMPPKRFLPILAKLLETADDVLQAVFDQTGANRDDAIVRRGTRHVLRMVATLAQVFDGDDPRTRYAANVMIFKSSEGLDEREIEAVSERLRFCDASVSVAKLKGVLDLDTELSTTAADENANPDDRLTALALPLPKNPKAGNRSKAMPGAPAAFFDREPVVFEDCRNLRKWCEEHGDFTEEIKKLIEEYFSEEKNQSIQSFISIPLFRTPLAGESAREEEPIAVLNIHCDRPNLLRASDSAAEQFVLVVKPFQLALVKLLLALKDSGKTERVAAAEATQSSTPDRAD